jgi:hypothetical protein
MDIAKVELFQELEGLYEEWETLGSQIPGMKPAAKKKAIARIQTIRRRINTLELTG